MSQPNQARLLREFIDIPEHTSVSDFVLKLTEGITDAEATLRDYVITDRLLVNFDEALGLIQSAVAGGASKAAYLHGSFGSGKSHFMAVLHALLRGDPAARGRDEFAGLLAKHDAWLAGRRFLLVPYHLLGAKSLEQAVLGGYVDHVLKLHPDAPIPAVHRTDALLDMARGLRAEIGDRQFIHKLPGGQDWDEDEWGESEPFWNSAKLDAAFAAPPDDPLRRKLVADLLVSWFTGFFSNAREDAEGFISLDRGLSEIAGHARSLGYDGLVLFLDELILWLASSIGDQQFVAREAQKVTNFVEGGDARRPVPVVSFIARQRDLRELVGGEVTGAVELGFQDTLDLARGRFDLITLEDRNLPVIAHERLLKPRDEQSAAAIAKEFETVAKLRTDVRDTLLGTEGITGTDLESFRASYPFSPAFMDTLVHVSNALQRSRTALKLMRQLLVDRRNDLRLGDLVPLGDLYEVISRGGDQPFTEKLRIEFETAQKLYDTKLRPYLLEQYSLTLDEVERVRRGGEGVDAKLAETVRAYNGDDRLMKTLLLSALAPSVPALRNLTARRLSALNYGSIRSMIPGNEVALVARKVEDWSTRFGEVKFTEADDPGVGLELVGIDIDSVLATATSFDTTGARKQLVKKLLWEEMGITATNQFFDKADLVWRGSRRSIEVLYGNVRDPSDLHDDAFHPMDPTAWRLLIDHPWDEGTHNAADDRNRVQELRRGRVEAQTVCWVPAHLTTERIGDLRRLVIINEVLNVHRFDTHASHLNPTDRQRARQALESQRDALFNKVRGMLRQAYGLAQKQPADVSTGYDDHLLTLHPDLRPTLALAAPMREALHHLAGQMLAEQYPDHPDFDPDRNDAIVRPADARTVLDYVRKAVESQEGRVEVERAHRAVMRRVANPLRLGEMHEAHFVLGRHWVQHFHQRAAQEGISGDLKVSDLERWLDEPSPQGLEPLVAHLVIASFAEQTDRTWVEYGTMLRQPPELTAIKAHLALREQPLPDEETWQAARQRAMDIFGANPPLLRRGRLVTLFVQQLSAEARQYRDAAHTLVARLEQRAARLGLDPETSEGRLHTARAAADLLDGLSSRQHSVEIVEHLAHANLGGPAQRAGRSIRSAAQVTDALAKTSWETFDIIAALPEPYAAEAEAIFGALHRAAQAEELTTSLQTALAKAHNEATSLLRKQAMARPAPQPQPQPPQTPQPVPGPAAPGAGSARAPGLAGQPQAGPGTADGAPSGTRRVSAAELETVLAELRALLRDRPAATVEITWRVID